MNSWQSTFKTIITIMPYLLNTGTLSDVTFLVGSGPNKKSFNAHKLLLAVRSDVFERMFFGALPEKEERIEIPDVSPDIFEIMLKFIYEDALGVKSMEEAIATFIVAHKYNITELMHLSTNYMKDNLNPQNASSVYQMSSIYDDKDLKSACSQIIKKNPEEVIKSEGFTQISFKTVEKMIEIICLNISNHSFVFESLIKWAKAEVERRQDDESAKNLRQIMDPFLPKIKFLSMSLEEFTQGPAASGILTDDEIEKIFMNIINAPNPAVLPDWCNKEKSLKLKALPSLAKPLVQILILDGPIVKRVGSLPPDDAQRNPSLYEVLCTIEMFGKDILLHGVRISNFSVPSVLLFFRIDGSPQAVDTRVFLPPPNKFSDETKLILKKPFLLKKNLKYHLKVIVRTRDIGIDFSDIIYNVDVPLPSSGHLKIRYIPSPSRDTKLLSFSELYYSECV